MMYPFCKYADETEVVFSDIKLNEQGEETIWVCFERPTEKGFDTIIFELPSYKIIRQEGEYTEQEIQNFLKAVEGGADLFYKYAREGGMKFA